MDRSGIIKIICFVIAIGVVVGLFLYKSNESKQREYAQAYQSSQAEQNYRKHVEEQKKASDVVNQVPAGYVDLGLSVYWKNSNERNSADDHGFYTYDDAKSKFGSQLPTKAQLEELVVKCTWTWSDSKKGYDVKGPNGNSIFLPAAGLRYCDGDVDVVGSIGGYWSSTPYDSDFAWYLYFYSGGVDMSSLDRCDGLSVRLVQGK